MVAANATNREASEALVRCGRRDNVPSMGPPLTAALLAMRVPADGQNRLQAQYAAEKQAWEAERAAHVQQDRTQAQALAAATEALEQERQASAAARAQHAQEQAAWAVAAQERDALHAEVARLQAELAARPASGSTTGEQEELAAALRRLQEHSQQGAVHARARANAWGLGRPTLTRRAGVPVPGSRRNAPALAEQEQVAKARLATLEAEHQAALAATAKALEARAAAASAEHAAERARLEQELAATRARLEALGVELAATQARLATAAASGAPTAADLAAAAGSGDAGAAAATRALREENAALARQVEWLTRERARLDELLTSTTQSLTLLRENARAVAEEHKERAARLVRLREELVARQERIHAHEQQLDHVRDQLREREAELARKEALIHDHKRTLDEHQRRVESSLQHKLSAIQARAQELAAKEARVAEERARLEAAEAERARRGQQLSEQEKRLASIRQALEQRDQGACGPRRGRVGRDGSSLTAAAPALATVPAALLQSWSGSAPSWQRCAARCSRTPSRGWSSACARRAPQRRATR